MKKVCMIAVMALLFCTLAPARGQRPMTPEDLYRLKGLADPQVSPDGQWIAYTVSVPDLKKNKSDSDIWLLPLKGGEPRQLTRSPEADHSPRFSPDSRQIAFISGRDGVANIYLIDMAGGEARKLTAAGTALYGPIWSGDGQYLVCGSRLLPKDKKSVENRTETELPECQARTIDRLLFRQWDRWLGDERNHLFLVTVKDGSLEDLTPAEADVPPVSLAGGQAFDISPDGRQVCFVRNDDPMLAISTNHDLFILDIPSMTEKKITANPALDRQPCYSPDGRYIAYTAMKKPGYEADREVLTLYDCRTAVHTPLTAGLDRSPVQVRWAPDSRAIYFTARQEGRSAVYRVDLKGRFKKITDEGYNVALDLTPDGQTLVCLRSFNDLPYEIFSLPLKGGKARQLTFTNADILKEIALPKLQEFRFSGAGGTKVHGYIQEPPGFDPQQKYPLVLCIHGGPQNMWADRFMAGWFTFPLVSSPGYVGLFINPRGSSGYGSAFREQVSRDYGGRCYEDLIKGLDYAVKHYDFIDGEKCAAVGGSFGGYSVNWIMGHTDRFKCIVSHAGLYNLTSFYGATEELWFPAWDMGQTPWDEPQLYEKWSPHRLAKNFKTPTLVTHGELDFRVPFAESLQLFTALQRQGVPSRLVVFPDEGHVIAKPQNNVRWWKEIHRWLAQYLK